MTLKNSFFSGMKEDRKRRVWTIVLFALICFMMTAVFELMIESYTNYINVPGFQSHIYELTESGMLIMYLFSSFTAAILYGFHGFGWLTKRQQVDFYHSQPIKREKRFAIQYLNGLLFFEVPMLLHLMICAFLIGIRGALDPLVVMNLGLNLLVSTLTFLLCYSLIIAAVMLTGNLIVSFLAAFVLFFYLFIVKLLAGVYYETYFETFVQKYAEPLGFLSWFSPCERFYQMAELVTETDKSGLPMSMFYVVLMILFFTVAAFCLYKKRPSECAGKALAFPVFGDIIRFLILVPGALSFGLLFAAWNGRNTVFWLYFGTVVGVIITHGFLEVIFHFDIRAALKKKVQLLFGILFMVALVSVFRFDLFGYDRYVPKAESLKAISYYINLGEYMDYYHLLDEEGIPYSAESDWRNDYYISREEYQLEASRTEETEEILTLLKGHLEQEEETNVSYRTYFLIKYELKNGGTEYRKYYIDPNYVKMAFQEIYDTEQGQNVLYPYRNLSGKEAGYVTVYSPIMTAEVNLELTAAEIEELAECYRKDLADRKMERLFEDHILGCISLHYLNKGGGTSQLDLYVSEYDVRMNAFLEKHQVTLRLPSENYVVESATLHNPYDPTETAAHPFWKGNSEVPLTKKQVDELLPLMVSDYYLRSSYDDIMMHCTMLIRNVKTGQIREIYYYLSEKEAPDYILIK